MPTPLFTIQVCNYNHGKFLPQCFAGIQRQTFQDYEVVITDDGSTDNSREIIAAHAARDRRIKPHYFPKNQGVMAAAKNVSERTTGTYVFGEGADDFIISEHFLATAAKALADHPQAAGFFGVAGLLTHETNQITGTLGRATQEGYLPAETCYREILCERMFIPGSCSIWRHELIRAFGGFDYSLGPQIDFLINHALPLKHGVIFSRQAYTCQRVTGTDQGYGNNPISFWDIIPRYEKIEKRMRELATPYPEAENDWRYWRARRAVDAIHTSGISTRPDVIGPNQ